MEVSFFEPLRLNGMDAAPQVQVRSIVYINQGNSLLIELADSNSTSTNDTASTRSNNVSQNNACLDADSDGQCDNIDNGEPEGTRMWTWIFFVTLFALAAIYLKCNYVKRDSNSSAKQGLIDEEANTRIN